MYKQKGLAPIVIILIVIGVLVLAGGVWYYTAKYERNKLSDQNPSIAPQPTVQGQTANWKTYRNEKYGFEIKYPLSWKQCVISNVVNEEFRLTGAEQNCSPSPHDKPTDTIVISVESAIFKKYPIITSLKKALEEMKNSIDKLFIVNGVGLFEIGGIKEITFNGMQALQVEEMSPAGYGESIGIYIFYSQNLRVAYAFDSSSVKMKNEGNQILSTFKFIK